VPQNALDNPLVLPILGLLIEHPRHAYAVFSELRDRYDYLYVRNATVYTLLGSLTDAGWVKAAGDEDPAVLAPTASGAAALAERVDRQLREAAPTGGPAFITALAYLGALPPARAAEVLAERIDRVRDEKHRLDLAISDAGQREIHMIEAHYLTARLQHDIEWLSHLAQRIDTGSLSWPR
jgi:DNA-binding PadR family transcriptional regulator